MSGRKYLVAAVLLLVLAGCGDETTTTVIQTPDTTTTTTVSGLSEDDAQVLEMLSTSSPKNLATVCNAIAKGYSREQAEQQAMDSLSELILEQGGQPSVVVDALLDEC